MIGMGLSHDHKVTARTSAEVAEGVRALALRQRSRGIKFGAKAIGLETVVSCALLALLDLSDADQDAVIDRFVDVLGEQTGLAVSRRDAHEKSPDALGVRGKVEIQDAAGQPLRRPAKRKRPG